MRQFHQDLIAKPYETTRHEGDNPGSRFVTVTARTTARGGCIGIRRCLEVSVAISSLTNFVNSVSLEKRTSMQRTMATHFDVASWASIMKITTQSQFDPPSLAFAPLLPCLCCLTWMTCLTTARICFCKLSSSSETCSLLTLGVAFPMGVISCFFAVSSAASSLCRAMTAEAATNGRLVERQGRTVRARANRMSSRFAAHSSTP